ncbi:MAG: SUMF1/EgtB/PvdO family nonheme iron enzyme [Myxococcota bacterium]
MNRTRREKLTEGMKLVLLGMLAALSACDCGESHELLVDAQADADAAPDVRGDAPVDDADARVDALTLPEVTPTSPDCREINVPARQACIEHGWFNMAKWSTQISLSTRIFVGSGLPRPQVPVFLETFLADRLEVTVEEYQAFAEASGTPLPPEECGWEVREIFQDRPRWVTEISDVSEARATHPMVCVTRAEAADYCAAQGGSLPTAAQWMRLGQDEYPAFRTFPWGDSPPPMNDPGWQSRNNGVIGREYARAGARGPNLSTAPVGARLSGASPHGILDLSGNASESISDCVTDLTTVYAGLDPLIRPISVFADSCEDAILIAGSSWRTNNNGETATTMTIYAFRDVRTEVPEHEDTLLGEIAKVGEERPLNDTIPTGTAGNERRSWEVGFRCVYPPEVGR